MNQAIITKYIGPSATKQARVKASCEGGSVTIKWNNAFNTEGNHYQAVCHLVEKLKWPKEIWHYGWLGDRMVAVRGD